MDPTNYWGQVDLTQIPSVTGPLQALQAAQQQSAQRALAGQQIQREMQQQATADAATRAALANPNADNLAALTIARPDIATAVKSAHDLQDEQAQRQSLQHFTGIYNYLDPKAPQTDKALDLIGKYQAAAKDAGKDTSQFDTMSDMIKSNPAQARMLAGMYLSQNVGADKLASTLGALGGEQRAQDAEQGKQDLTAAQTAEARATAKKAGFITVKDANGNDAIVSVDALGGSPGAPGTAPTSSATASAKTPVGQQIQDAASAMGATAADQDYLQRTAALESSGNPGAANGASKGLYGFHPDTFAKVGGGDINSVPAQTVAALKLARQNAAGLQHVLGRPPTPDELYLAHQQGLGAATALLTADPTQNAIAALQQGAISPRMAQQSITGNGGSANMTAGDFIGLWKDRYAKAGGQAQGDAAPAVDEQPGVVFKTPGYGDVDSSGALSPAGVEMVGTQYLRLGPDALKNLGQGKTGVQNKAKILNWASTAAAEAGTSNPELVLRFVQNKANIGALNQVQKNLSMITASEATLSANADLVMKYAKPGVGPTGQPWLDTPINAIRRAGGSVAAKDLDNVMKTTADEYAKILTTTTGTGGGATSDGARKEAHDLLNSNMTLRQMIGAIDIAKQEAANRHAANAHEVARLGADISGTAAPAAPGATPPAAPAAGGWGKAVVVRH